MDNPGQSDTVGNSNTGSSGEGTRPTSAGGVDKIGAADPFTNGKIPDGQNAIPDGRETMGWKRQDDELDTTSKPAPRSSDGEN